MKRANGFNDFFFYLRSIISIVLSKIPMDNFADITRLAVTTNTVKKASSQKPFMDSFLKKSGSSDNFLRGMKSACLNLKKGGG